MSPCTKDIVTNTLPWYRIETPTPYDVGPVNVYLLKEEPVTLIDAGANTPEALAALLSGLRRHGLELRDIQRIILTHHHLDHVGLAAAILDASDAEVYGHPGIPHQALPLLLVEAAWYQEAFLALMDEMGVPEKDGHQMLELWRTYGTGLPELPLNHPLEDGGTAGLLSVYFVPGHSATDTLLVDHATGVAFTGDHVLEGIAPNPMLRLPEPGRARARSLIEYQQSLHRTRQLDLRGCLPGHGKPFTHYREVIDGILARQERKNQRVLRLLGPKEATPFEISHRLYPRQLPGQAFLCLSAAASHLEVLESRGLAMAERENGVLRYRIGDAPELLVAQGVLGREIPE